jgi:hypothetical protein
LAKIDDNELREVGTGPISPGHKAYMPTDVMKIIDVKDGNSVVYFEILDPKYKDLLVVKKK